MINNPQNPESNPTSNPNMLSQSTGSQSQQQPDLTKPENQSDNFVFHPFPDGSLFRHAPNPLKAGTFVLADSKGQSVALAANKIVADFLCRGAAMLMQAMRLQSQIKQSPPSLIVPDRKIILPGLDNS